MQLWGDTCYLQCSVSDAGLAITHVAAVEYQLANTPHALHALPTATRLPTCTKAAHPPYLLAASSQARMHAHMPHTASLHHLPTLPSRPRTVVSSPRNVETWSGGSTTLTSPWHPTIPALFPLPRQRREIRLTSTMQRACRVSCAAYDRAHAARHPPAHRMHIHGYTASTCYNCVVSCSGQPILLAVNTRRRCAPRSRRTPARRQYTAAADHPSRSRCAPRARGTRAAR